MFNEKLAESAHGNALERSPKLPKDFTNWWSENLREMQSLVETEVRAKPLAALLIAGSVGLFLGLFCCRR